MAKRARTTAVTDGIIPAAPGLFREITPRIRVAVYNKGGWLCATYTDVREYASPHDAPLYARMKPAGNGNRGAWNGAWQGEVIIQTFSKTETAALAALLDSLDELQLEYEPAARAILVALACTTEVTPWEQRPIGVRGPKPRRARTKWRDENGRRVPIYLDTYRRHADPDCPCEHCTAARAADPTTQK